MTFKDRLEWTALVAKTMMEIRLWLCEQEGIRPDFSKT